MIKRKSFIQIISRQRAIQLKQLKGKIPRRTLIESPVPKPKPVSRLKIRFMPNGKVIAPSKYYEVKPGKLRVKSYATIKDFAAAVRREWHKVTGIQREFQKIDYVLQASQSIRFELIEQGKNFNELQRKNASELIKKLSEMLIEKRIPLSEAKKKAIERFEKAAKLLEEKKVSAAIATLVGAENDLIVRKNELIPQIAFTPRTLQATRERYHREERKTGLIISFLFESMDSLTRLSPLTKTETQKFSQKLTNVASKLKKTKIKILREASEKIESSSKLILKGKIVPALKQLELALNKVLLFHSQRFALRIGVLQRLQLHKSFALKKRITINQLTHFLENFEYYASIGEKKQTMTQLTKFLSMVEHVLVKEEKAKNARKTVFKANQAFQRRKFTECEQLLMHAIQELEQL